MAHRRLNFPLYIATIAVAIGGATLLARPAAAQQATGFVAGRVTADGEALQGATVFVASTQQGALTRGDGSYRLQLPAGRRALRVRLIGYTSRADTVDVVAGETVTRNYALTRAATTLEAVAVVGSRGEARTVIEAPVPIDVLSGPDLRTSGRTETAAIIQQLAPSFNFPRPSVTDGTDHVRPATLRGLGPDQVLVLVNGKRRYPSALVNLNGSIGRGTAGIDLNAIPASMIDRVEVLREGAAAQYGSDAIAGVINVVLKSGGPGEITTTVGGAATTFGAYGAERSVRDGESVQAAANFGRPLGEGGQAGFFHVGAELRDRDQTNRSLGDPRPQTFAEQAANVVRTNETGAINHRYGDAKLTDGALFYNAAYRLGGGARFYSFGGTSNRQGDAAGFFRRALDNRTIRALYPNGFLPLIKSDIWDASAAAGVSGALGGWTFDLSEVLGGNSFQFDVDNSANVTLGAQSPRRFDAGQLGFKQSVANLDASREFTAASGLTLRTALGAEYRWEGYTIDAGESASYRDGGVRILDGPATGQLGAVGAQVFPGYRPSDAVNASRSNTAAYLDLESDLTRSLLVTAAGRMENYSDFGTQSTGRVAARFSPVRQVNFRGTVGTGFRAPSLQQSFYSSTATNFTNGIPFDVRTFPVNTPEAKLLGAVALKPEKSKNYGVGVAVEPLRSLSFTVDYYRIDIDDRIVLSENFQGADIQRLFEQAGLRGVTGGRYFTNAVDTRTRGVDVVANYGLNFGDNGIARVTAGYNSNRTRVTNVIPTPPQLGNRGEALFGRRERARIEEGQPRNNFLASTVFDRGRLGLTLRTQRYGDVTSREQAGNESLDQTFGAKWISDASITVRTLRQLALTVGEDNIFDVYPDANDDTGNIATGAGGNANFGIFPYSSYSPFGFNGRFVYVRLSYGL